MGEVVKPWDETWHPCFIDMGGYQELERITTEPNGRGDSVVICDCGVYPPKMADRAPLLMAAPELYRALARLVEIVDGERSGKSIDAAKAALRKARGET